MQENEESQEAYVQLVRGALGQLRRAADPLLPAAGDVLLHHQDPEPDFFQVVSPDRVRGTNCLLSKEGLNDFSTCYCSSQSLELVHALSGQNLCNQSILR